MKRAYHYDKKYHRTSEKSRTFSGNLKNLFDFIITEYILLIQGKFKKCYFDNTCLHIQSKKRRCNIYFLLGTYFKIYRGFLL